VETQRAHRQMISTKELMATRRNFNTNAITNGYDKATLDEIISFLPNKIIYQGPNEEKSKEK